MGVGGGVNPAESSRLSPSTVVLLVVGLGLYVVTAGVFIEFTVNVLQGTDYGFAAFLAAVPVPGAVWAFVSVRRGRESRLSRNDIARRVGGVLLNFGVVQFVLAGLIAGLSVP